MNNSENKSGSGKSKRLIIIAIIAAFLAVAIAAGFIISALVENARMKRRIELYGPVIMEAEGQTVHLSLYEFLLSRMKGTLYNSGYPVRVQSFWGDPAADTGKTHEEYYHERILETCKAYLASLVLYEQLCESGELAEMPQSVYDEIDALIELNIGLGYVADGSRDKMNEILSKYGVNIDSWREAMVVIAKADYVQQYLYGGKDATKIGENLKDEFFEDNYHRFKHILIANFYYKNVTDSFGNEVYFTDEGKIAYDTENGVRRYDSSGEWFIRDEYGDVVYFASESSDKPLYDKKNGQTRFVTDSDNVIQKFYYTEDEMREREALAESITALESGDYSGFESKASLGTDYSGIWNDEYTGFYLSDIERMAYSDYMKEMLDKLKVMQDGQIDMVEADDGYHVFMKYEREEGAYADEKYEKWFESFNSSLVSELFLVKCKKIYGEMTFNDGVIAGARSIRELGINTDY